MSDSPVVRRRFQFGLRSLLITVTLVAIAVGWIGRLHVKARERSVLVSELAGVGVLVDLREPTGVGLLVRKFFPQREPWLQERLGVGWFERPTGLACWKLDRSQIPYVIDRLRRLGTVRELQLRDGQLLPVAAELRRQLPGVEVVTADDLASPYYHSRVRRVHFAAEGVALLVLLALGVVCVIFILAWPLARRQRSSAATR